MNSIYDQLRELGLTSAEAGDAAYMIMCDAEYEKGGELDAADQI